MKKCMVCLEQKELELFNRDNREPDEKLKTCKSCQSKYSKAWRLKNPDHHRNWRKANPKKAYACSKRWLDAHPETRRAMQRRFWKNNPAKAREHNARRNAAKAHRTPKWLTKSDWIEIKWAYQIAVDRSKETGIPHEVDHIIPLRGKHVSGLHVPQNLQIITMQENVRKHNKFELATNTGVAS